jgi:LysR family transcriptional regulator, glycine cleavage system transcriptional activator
MNGIHMRRFRNVPPLQYLLGFEAAARLGSFSRAAEELGLSQSAVSHEMRLLEERIGQPLFIRHGRTIRLTDAGREYQRSVGKSLEQLEDGYRRLEPFRKPGSVVIYAPRDFAARWLLPRLHALRQAVPTCEPWIDTSGVPVDFGEMEVSIAIVRMREPDPALQSRMLFQDALTPVASPRLIPKALRRPIDVLNYTLIHDERPEDWSDWFESAGVEAGDKSAGLDFSDNDFALSAAERGLGVALASLPLANESIASSQLIQPVPHILETGKFWFALTTAKELADPITRDVWNWLAGMVDHPAGQYLHA